MTQVSSRITIDPSICHGKPWILGMRYPVEAVLEWLAAGMDIDDIVADCPDLEREDVLAALDFAARLSRGTHSPGDWACQAKSASAASARPTRLTHTQRIDLLAA